MSMFVIMVHFDPSANIDSEMASLRLPDWSLYLSAPPPVSRLHLLTTSVNMSRVLSVCLGQGWQNVVTRPDILFICGLFKEAVRVPESHGSQRRETVKYGHEFRGTRNQQ
jgi:hypothetical protein